MSLDNNEDIKKLLEAANNPDNLIDCMFDKFLREYGFSEDDLSERIAMDDLYFFYSCYYYSKKKKLPRRKNFASPSVILKLYRIRQRPKVKDPNRPDYKNWGLKCSKEFKKSYNTFKDRAGESWQKKYKAVQGAKRSHQSRRVSHKEEKQLETVLASLGLTDATIAK